ncbi:ATP-binding protein [Actinacidiphila alni]|uniref:ATP-binding protein n=1 Tax=Actinacidiphila alni TaxID=380248 RepID=UPI001FE8BD3F|nr:ATP-binding protein [Actinacidiphila alni]
MTNRELRRQPSTDGRAPVPTGPATARGRVREVLLAAGLTPETIRMAWADAMLVTSELTTNAVRHGGGLTGFSARVEAGSLELRISDASDELPTTRDPGNSFLPGGFGMPLVKRLCRSLDVRPEPGGGKTVVVVLPLLPASG